MSNWGGLGAGVGDQLQANEEIAAVLLACLEENFRAGLEALQTLLEGLAFALRSQRRFADGKLPILPSISRVIFC